MNLTIAKLTALGLLASSAPALAQFTIPTIPSTPQNIAPSGGTVIRGMRPNLSRTDFVWDQPGAIFRPLIDPPPAQAFAICLKPAVDLTPCAWPGDWNALAGAIPRTAIRNLTGTVIGYRYRFTPPTTVVDAKIDIPLVWRVAACASSTGANCASSGYTPFRISTLNLLAENISIGGSGATTLIVDGQARNLGQVAAPADVRGEIVSRKALLTANNQCETDANIPSIENNGSLRAVMGDGQIKVMATLPRTAQGTIDTSNIRGIFNVNDPLLATRTATQAASQFPANQLSPRPVVTATASVPASGLPLGVLTVFKIDGLNALPEYDKTDNVKVECDTLY
jgi:hypothetical protein